MFKYAMISISTLVLFSATPILARAEIAKAPPPLTAVSKNKTPVVANICGNGIVEEGEICDGGNNCNGTCDGGILHSNAPSNYDGLHTQRPETALVQDSPQYQNPNSQTTPEEVGSHPEVQEQPAPPYGPINPGQESPEELAPATCGNGIVESGEACDDGNTMTGDGCNGSCKIEDDSFAKPPIEKERLPGPRGDASQVGFESAAAPSSSGCSLQALAPQTHPTISLASLILFAYPILRNLTSRRS